MCILEVGQALLQRHEAYVRQHEVHDWGPTTVSYYLTSILLRGNATSMPLVIKIMRLRFLNRRTRILILNLKPSQKRRLN